jgi:hypothetical protein
MHTSYIAQFGVIMSQPVIHLLLSFNAVKVQCDSVVGDDGATKEVPSSVVCAYCPVTWKFQKNGNKPSSTLIVPHLYKHHKAEWNTLSTLYPVINASLLSSPRSGSSSTNISPDVSASSSPVSRRSSSVKRTSSTSLTNLSTQTVYDIDEETVEAAINDVVTGFAVFNISFVSSERPLFSRFIHSCSFLLGERGIYRSALKKWTLSYASKLRSKLLVFLAQPNFYCTLAVDGWTNTCGDKVWNVTIICKGVSYYWCSLVNPKSLDYMKAEYIYNKIAPTVQLLLEQNIRLVAIVTDNEPVMRAAARLIRASYNLIDVPCAAHTIQLILTDMFKIDFIAAFNKHVDDLIQ